MPFSHPHGARACSEPIRELSAAGRDAGGARLARAGPAIPGQGAADAAEPAARGELLWAVPFVRIAAGNEV